MPFATAIEAATTHEDDFVLPYVEDLRNVVDMDAIRAAGLKLGVDPLGGAARPLLGADQRGLRPRHRPWSTRRSIRPSRFMTVDHDGKIRMDCSSPYAMARLVELKDRYRVAFGNDPDADRHGIVTPVGRADEPQPLPGRGHPLPARRIAPAGRPHAAVGKTLVSSSMIDRVVRAARPPAARGAGRLQVVRGRAVRRLVLLRRRGERRGELPAPATAPCGPPTRTA